MSNEQEQQQATLDAAFLAADVPLCGMDEVGYCITCADEALPARVLSVDAAAGLALVEVIGTTTEIDITLVEAVASGDWLLVHGGVAIAHAEEQDL